MMLRNVRICNDNTPAPLQRGMRSVKIKVESGLDSD